MRPQLIEELSNSDCVIRRSSSSEQAKLLAEDIAGCLNDAIAIKDWAGIAFSGGSTPALMFEQLARQAVDWSKVSITLVDERCVGIDSNRSNTATLYKAFIDKLAVKPQFYPLYQEGESDAECALRLESFPNRFDIVHLGMGEDAHTASFFPDADNIAELLDLEQSKKLMYALSASSQERRITWTLAALLNSAHIVLQLRGQAKWNVVESVYTKAYALIVDQNPESASALSQYHRLKSPIFAVLEQSLLFRSDGVSLQIDYAVE